MAVQWCFRNSTVRSDASLFYSCFLKVLTSTWYLNRKNVIGLIVFRSKKVFLFLRNSALFYVYRSHLFHRSFERVYPRILECFMIVRMYSMKEIDRRMHFCVILSWHLNLILLLEFNVKLDRVLSVSKIQTQKSSPSLSNFHRN